MIATSKLKYVYCRRRAGSNAHLAEVFDDDQRTSLGGRQVDSRVIGAIVDVAEYSRRTSRVRGGDHGARHEPATTATEVEHAAEPTRPLNGHGHERRTPGRLEVTDGEPYPPRTGLRHAVAPQRHHLT